VSGSEYVQLANESLTQFGPFGWRKQALVDCAKRQLNDRFLSPPELPLAGKIFARKGCIEHGRIITVYRDLQPLFDELR